MKEITPPFAPHRAEFPCPRLLSLSARSQIGGARETLLATVVAVRLVASWLPPFPLSAEVRRTRAESARQWLTALNIPAKVRTQILNLIAATAKDDPKQLLNGLEQVIEITKPHLDRGSTHEMAQLMVSIREIPLLAEAQSSRVR